MKLSNLRDSAGGIAVPLPRELLVVVLLPFLVCLTIMLSIPGIELRLLIHSLIVFAVLWTIGGATCAAFLYFEDREQEGGSAAVRSLVWVAGLLLPIVVTVLILGRLA
jgi:hypothetical protein